MPQFPPLQQEAGEDGCYSLIQFCPPRPPEGIHCEAQSDPHIPFFF